jgi:hypothetical protein
VDKYLNEVPEWAKMSKQDYKLMGEQMQARKWSANVWEQVAHELVWVLGMLEENPTSPKVWKQVFRVLNTYEEVVRNG